MKCPNCQSRAVRLNGYPWYICIKCEHEFRREEMIQELVDKFMENRDTLRAKFTEKHPEDYKGIVTEVVKLLKGTYEYSNLDPDRIHEIDDGDYQGTLLYMIASTGYQPGNYWYVKVDYGSCSGCDTLEGIREYSSNPPNEEQAQEYMTLALHIVQGLKKLEG